MMKRLAVPDNSFMSFGPHRYRLWYGTVCSQCSASSLYSWNVLAEPSHWGTPSLLRSIAVIARRGLTPTAIQIKSTRMPPWAPLPCKRSAQPTSTSSPEDKETYGALPMKWLCDFELALGQLLLIHLTGGGWTANCHNARIACHRVPFKCNQATAYSSKKKKTSEPRNSAFPGPGLLVTVVLLLVWFML